MQLSGYVTDSVTGDPIAGASIYTRAGDGRSVFANGSTDANGAFAFDNPQNLDVSFAKDGYNDIDFVPAVQLSTNVELVPVGSSTPKWVLVIAAITILLLSGKKIRL